MGRREGTGEEEGESIQDEEFTFSETKNHISVRGEGMFESYLSLENREPLFSYFQNIVFRKFLMNK